MQKLAIWGWAQFSILIVLRQLIINCRNTIKILNIINNIKVVQYQHNVLTQLE